MTTCIFVHQSQYTLKEPTIAALKWPSSKNGNPAQLPLHLSIFPPQERHPQKTCLEHQCSVWLGHAMASCKTQVHSKTGSSDLDVHTVSKPSGTLNHHPRPRVKYKGQVRTNEDATIRTYPLLCSSTPGQQHSGAFSHSFPECHRWVHQMVPLHSDPWSLTPNLQLHLKQFLRKWHLQVLAHQVPGYHAIHHPSRRR